MALQYVTLTEAKAQVSVFAADSSHDTYLTHLIHAASAAVKNYLGDKSVYRAALDDDDEPDLDSNFEPILESFDSATQPEKVRDEVKHAVLLLIGEWFRNREGMGSGYAEGGYLPLPVRALLMPLRDPQLK